LLAVDLVVQIVVAVAVRGVIEALQASHYQKEQELLQV
jgi:hypothetical protein